MERLQKVIAETGFASRRKAEELIKQGKVYVNGIKITELGTKVDGNDIITINGNEVQKEDKVYYLMNKPRGVISSVSDNKERKTVTDFINTDKRVYPVGRLDYDTTGLIIITNDGKLANILMHPKNKVEKKYVVKLNKALAITDLQKLKKGIKIDDIKCTPTKLKLKKNDTDKDFSIVEISIIEGRNHIIKKLFLELGYLVDKLSRIEYGFLDLGTLKSGEYRLLNIKEVKKLYDYKN
ncbi:MAG: pseudouridine synthase [Bacilli bacterium]|nr:pseudouridine synthase [Bacilli bacterium]